MKCLIGEQKKYTNALCHFHPEKLNRKESTPLQTKLVCTFFRAGVCGGGVKEHELQYSIEGPFLRSLLFHLLEVSWKNAMQNFFL